MKAFWIVYEILLLGCEALFILRLVSVWRALKRIKRRYAFAPVEIPVGHKVQPTRAEILPALRRCRTELAAWCIIAAEAPPVAGEARRGWRSGQNLPAPKARQILGTARGLAKQI